MEATGAGLAGAQACLKDALGFLKREVLKEERLPAGSSATLTELSDLRAVARVFMEQLDTLLERRSLRIEAKRDALQLQYDDLAETADDLEYEQEFLTQQCKKLKADHAQSLTEHEQAMAKSAAQNSHLEQERYALSLEKDGLIAQQSSLQQQLTEGRERLLCGVCLDKPRDTLIMPCLHFQYCFSCLMKHRNANSNTCPTCRGDIGGLCMSSFLSK